jgi:hypothetical protein
LRKLYALKAGGFLKTKRKRRKRRINKLKLIF